MRGSCFFKHPACKLSPMSNPRVSRESLIELENALRERLRVIADHEFRDRDPAGHLEALKSASEGLARLGDSLAPGLPPRLAHFLERCSYDKAIAFVEGMLGEKQADH